MEIDAPDGGGDQSSLRSPRFTHWMAFLILSTVTMGSTIEAVSLHHSCLFETWIGFHFPISSFDLHSGTNIISHIPMYIHAFICVL